MTAAVWELEPQTPKTKLVGAGGTALPKQQNQGAFFGIPWVRRHVLAQYFLL